MTERTQLRAQVGIYEDARRRYEALPGDKAWLLYDVLADMVQHKQLAVSTTTYTDAVQFGAAAGNRVQDAILIENGDIKGMILRPIIDEWTDIDSDDFEVKSTGDDAVVEDWVHDYWPFNIIVQVQSKTDAVMGCAPGQIAMTDDEGNPVCVLPTNAQCVNPGYEAICDEGTPICRDPLQHGITGPIFCSQGTPQCIGGIVYCTTGQVQTEGGWVYSQFKSKFDLIANPFFLAMLYRRAPEKDFMDDVQAGTQKAPFTEVMFGVTSKTGWSLVVPYGDEPYLLEFDPTDSEANANGYARRDWTHGHLAQKDSTGDSRQGFWYWIGVIDGKICVSEDQFQDNFAYYQPHKLKPETIKQSRVYINQWPGQIGFAIRPLKMNTANLLRDKLWVPNEAFETEDVETSVWGATRPNASLSDDVGLSGSHVQMIGTGGGSFQWLGQWTPGTLTDEGVTSYSCATLTAVRVRYEATLTDNGTGSATQYEDYVPEIMADLEAEENAAGMSTLYIANHHEWAKNMQAGRLVEITQAGWEFHEWYGYGYLREWSDLNTLDALWTLEPDWDDNWCQVQLVDLLGMLALAQVDFEGLMLGGLSAYNAKVFVAEMNGIGPAWYDFENLGTLWDGYPPLYEPFKFDAGTSWADVLREIAKAAGSAGVWCENNVLKTGCPYCRTKRTTDNYETHQDNGWLSSGCRAADVVRAGETGIDKVFFANPEDATEPDDPNELARIQATRRNIGSWDYANEVTVIGQDEDGAAYTRQRYDWDALYGTDMSRYFGFPISFVEKDEQLGTAAKVTARIVELYEKMSKTPLFVRATAMADTSLRLGHVIKIEGGERMNVHNKLFRVVGLEHSLRKDAQALTRITGRYMTEAA